MSLNVLTRSCRPGSRNNCRALTANSRLIESPLNSRFATYSRYSDDNPDRFVRSRATVWIMEGSANPTSGLVAEACLLRGERLSAFRSDLDSVFGDSLLFSRIFGSVSKILVASE